VGRMVEPRLKLDDQRGIALYDGDGRGELGERAREHARSAADLDDEVIS
jgi:hypothetical protein